MPGGLRYAVAAPRGPEPDGIEEVEVYVPPYLFPDVDAGLFARMPRLRVVQTLTAGIEHIAPHLPDGVVLCNGRGIHDASTAELAVTLVLASLRGIPEFVTAQQDGRWAWEWRPALADKRVLILGYGQIGAAIEARLAPFECDVVRVARRPRAGVHPVSALGGCCPRWTWSW